MPSSVRRFDTPQRRLIRRILKWLSKPVFDLLTHLEITGEENLPKHGPLIVVGNHFSFIEDSERFAAAVQPFLAEHASD